MGNALTETTPHGTDAEVITRSYQQEMLDASLTENIIIAQDTGSGKTHIAVLRMKIECDREPHKVTSPLYPVNYDL
jgi:endoribonuclease Dicer